jgi:hypothetical protein
MADMGSKCCELTKSGGWLYQNGRFADCYDQLGACLGSGGMGSVWAARVGNSAASNSLCPGRAAGTWVAVKAIPIELEDGERSAGSLHSGLRECLSTFRDLSPVHVVRYDSYWIEEQQALPAEIRGYWEHLPRSGTSSPSNSVPRRSDADDESREARERAESPAGSDIVSLRFRDGGAADQLRLPPMHPLERQSSAVPSPGGRSPLLPSPSLGTVTDSCGFFFEDSVATPFSAITDSPAHRGSHSEDRAVPPPPERRPLSQRLAEAVTRKRPARIVLLIEMELMGPKPSDSGKLTDKSSAEDRLTLRAWRMIR